MNRREKLLAGGVLLAIVLFVGASFLPEDSFSFKGFGGGQLDQARRAFREGRTWLQKKGEIESEYRRVEAQFPEREGIQTSESTFSNQLSKMLTERGWPSQSFQPPKSMAIPGIDDYQFIEIAFKLQQADPQKVIDLLADFQKTGFLIKDFKVTLVNPDTDRLNVDLNIARLTKLTEAERKRLEARRNRS